MTEVRVIEVKGDEDVIISTMSFEQTEAIISACPCENHTIHIELEMSFNYINNYSKAKIRSYPLNIQSFPPTSDDNASGSGYVTALVIVLLLLMISLMVIFWQFCQKDYRSDFCYSRTLKFIISLFPTSDVCRPPKEDNQLDSTLIQQV